MNDLFEVAVASLLEQHRPSKHAFFDQLSRLEARYLTPLLLEDLYDHYQAAMHATRAMVYFLPGLDTIDLRMEKFKIIMDDDGSLDGDSHHHQLARSWAHMLGHSPARGHNEFGALNVLEGKFGYGTGPFIAEVRRLYQLSLGAWLMVEGLAHDWIGAWLRALEHHFPGIGQTDYFRANYSTGIEIVHAKQALKLAERSSEITGFPLRTTLEHAHQMGGALDELWSGMGRLISDSQP